MEQKSNVRSQEISVIFTSDLAGEVAGRKLEFVPLWTLGCKGIGLLLQKLQRVSLVDFLALSGGGVVSSPLPQLAARYFGSCSVLLNMVLV